LALPRRRNGRDIKTWFNTEEKAERETNHKSKSESEFSLPDPVSMSRSKMKTEELETIFGRGESAVVFRASAQIQNSVVQG